MSQIKAFSEIIMALKIQVQDLTQLNIYLREAINEMRKRGFSRSAAYSKETEAEKFYLEKIAIMEALIMKNEALLKTADRVKNNDLTK